MTNFKYFSLDEVNHAEGLVVVIDVLRAFTTAAYAFNIGVQKILPVAEVNQALKLRTQNPGSLIMGEVDGVKPPAFDYGNSPASISKLKLRDKIMIQRTSAGTQGIINACNADLIIAASFVVAKATAEEIRRLDPDKVSFVITGKSMGRDGDEDRACGEYIQALISNQVIDPEVFTNRVKYSSAGRWLINESNSKNAEKDYVMSIQTNIFPFTLPIVNDDSLLTMICNEI